LKNAEIPIGFSNIRSQNNSNIFSFIANSITYIELPYNENADQWLERIKNEQVI
jgi:hypothetical protein